jgi:integrase
MASTFSYRGGWPSQVVLPGGRTRTKDFQYNRDAKQWGAEMEASIKADHVARLGGPTCVTLAELLVQYAHKVTLAKGGRESELNRINHYLRSADLPLLRGQEFEAGKWQLVESTPQAVDLAVATGRQAHLSKRREARARTYALIGRLAVRKVSTLQRGDIHDLMTTMKADGLSDSTIQKEIALLRHAFNIAINEWGWVGFANPCANTKLGKSVPRSVHVSPEELNRLYQACAECDNPYFLPLVDCAFFLTARAGSLRQLRWQDVNFVDRKIFLRKTKTGPVHLDLPLRVKAVLEAMQATLPMHPSGRVFPMSANAVNMAWEGVRAKAGLKGLQFRDLRHLGGTHYAKRVPNAHVLREILGHKTLHQAMAYVNLASEELKAILDAPE